MYYVRFDPSPLKLRRDKTVFLKKQARRNEECRVQNGNACGLRNPYALLTPASPPSDGGEGENFFGRLPPGGERARVLTRGYSPSSLQDFEFVACAKVNPPIRTPREAHGLQRRNAVMPFPSESKYFNLCRALLRGAFSGATRRMICAVGTHSFRPLLRGRRRRGAAT